MFSLLKATLLAIIATTALCAPAFEADVEARQWGGCFDVKVLFARGTDEPPTLGQVVGPQFKIDLHSALPGKSVDFQGLDYTPTLLTFQQGGDEAGALEMANQVAVIVKQCPYTRIVLSGCGQVVYRATSQISSDMQPHIAAIVTFGDPDAKKLLSGPMQSRRLTFCHLEDLVCNVQFSPPFPYPSHIDYASDSPAAAAFVASHY